MPDQPTGEEPAARPSRRPSLPDSATTGPSSPARGTGLRGERLAALHLERRGFTILARNVRTRAGEIDLVAFDGATIAFVEVKTTRLASATGDATARRRIALERALERVQPAQRRRLRGLALDWLRSRPQSRPRGTELRFDAIGVVIDRGGELLALEHLEDAW
jgi:putative endonuclease